MATTFTNFPIDFPGLFSQLKPLPPVHRLTLISAILANPWVYLGLTKGISDSSLMGIRTALVAQKLSLTFKDLFVVDPKKLFFVDAKKKAPDVLKQMIERNESCALVRVASTVTGMCTYSHLASVIAKQQPAAPVSEFMVKGEEMASCTVNNTIADIGTAMAQSGVEYLPIKNDEGDIVYVVSAMEITKKLFESLDDTKRASVVADGQ